MYSLKGDGTVQQFGLPSYYACKDLPREQLYLGCNVAPAAAPRVKEEGEVGRVVGRQKGGLERGKVRQVHPAPARHLHVLALDVAMADASVVALGELRQGEEASHGDVCFPMYPVVHLAVC